MKNKRNDDNWLDITAGILTSYLFVIIIFIYIIIFLKIDLKNNMFLLLIPLFYTFYEQWKSNQFSKINTNFTEKKNSEILESVLEKLNWESYISYGEIKIRKNQILNYPLDITFKTKSKTIYYNFGYENLYRVGRLNFLFGVSTIQKLYFLYHLKKEIKVENSKFNN